MCYVTHVGYVTYGARGNNKYLRMLLACDIITLKFARYPLTDNSWTGDSDLRDRYSYDDETKMIKRKRLDNEYKRNK